MPIKKDTREEALAKAQADLASAEERLSEAQKRHNLAVAHAAELRDRNKSGDGSVTGLALLEAGAEVEVTEGLLSAAVRDADTFRQVAQEHLAEKVAHEVASRVEPAKVEARVQDASANLITSIAEVLAALKERDEVCDQAGRTLAAAGVPVRTNVGPIRYDNVRRGSSGTPVAGRYNVTISGERISHRDDIRTTRREAQRIIEEALTTALKSNGLKWTSSGVEAA